MPVQIQFWYMRGELMKHIALLNGKGGTGKTTLTMLLAYGLSAAGRRVAVMDLDPQGTATKWFIGREDHEVKLYKEGETYDHIMIDTPPIMGGEEQLRAIKMADLIIVPSSPSPADLYTSQDTAALLEREGVTSISRLLFNQVQANTVLARELDQIAELIKLPVLQNRLKLRQAYQKAVLLGWGALANEAKAEVFKVAIEITTPTSK